MSNNRKHLSVKELRQLEKIITKFVDDYRISCPEVVWDSDNVIENAYELISKLSEIVGFYEYPDEL